MVERFERFTFAISEIYRYWHKIAADEMEKYGLKGTYSVYLVTMYRFPDGVTAAALCELCGKDKSDVSRTVAVLESKGLVKREEVNKNLYRARLKLTDEGKKAAEHVRERAKIAVEIGGKGISAENREKLYKMLETIAANLQIVIAEGLPESCNLKGE